MCHYYTIRLCVELITLHVLISPVLPFSYNNSYFSLRATPSFVAFGERQRVMGVSAKNQLLTNLQKTVFGFKHLLGRKYNDPVVQENICDAPYFLSQGKDGNILIRVDYLGEENAFTPEQITAMLFTKLKNTAENALKANVKDLVISCPSYFTDGERKALLSAGSIAGLNVLKVIITYSIKITGGVASFSPLYHSCRTYDN